MEQAAKPTRQNRTITVDFQEEATYFQLLGDTKAFVEFVRAFLLSLGFQLLHKTSCSKSGRIGSAASSPMVLTARRAVCGHCSLGHASATVSATRSTSCPANSW